MKKGFTLIELLIVIALLGTLAVALLAAIDPFEQFRKGTDTGTRNTAQEIFNAAIRYYSLKQSWPDGWDTVDDEADTIQNLDPAVIIGPLISAGELKDNFIELAEGSLNSIYISKKSDALDDSHIALCFDPQSKSFTEADSNTKFPSANFNVDGVTPISDSTNECAVNGGSNEECYWCIY
jgi:prepilin-type N-terminal cleavage/methylation domain-containing protein